MNEKRDGSGRKEITFTGKRWVVFERLLRKHVRK